MGGRISDLTDTRFGRLVATSLAGRTATGHSVWHCRCDCGNELTVRSPSLVRGYTKSCGCLRKERAARIGKEMAIHGHCPKVGYSPTYQSWRAMIYRCEHPTNAAYPYYGAKGIRVCDRWKTFANFLADMGERPDGKTIDRRDNTKDYEPSNCRWATRKEQDANKG